MLYSLETVRDAIRTENGKRVFWLYPGDRLTAAAEDWLKGEGIDLRRRDRAPQEFTDPWGGKLMGKPEELTHLSGQKLVPKTHRRIRFRGQLDLLEAECLLCMLHCPHWDRELEEMLQLCKAIMRADVLEEPIPALQLGGMEEDELRKRSHYPQNYYRQGHFQPRVTDGESLLRLNRLRTEIRRTELMCAEAFSDRDGLLTRTDLLRAFNRMSSFCYLLMIREKAKQK